MSKIALERGGTMHPREDFVKVFNFTSAAGEIVLDADGCSTLALDLRGTFNATFVVEGTLDGINYATVVPMRPMNQSSILWVTSISGSTQGLWVGKVGHFLRVRVRSTSYTSGPCLVTMMCGTGAFDDALLTGMTASIVTTLSAAGAAATLTIPSPGTGLRAYITYISLIRFAAAATTAAATPTNVGTTNMPGGLAFSLGAEALAIGAMVPNREDYASPMPASSQNTATTLVVPAVTGVIWRLTAGFNFMP